MVLMNIFAGQQWRRRDKRTDIWAQVGGGGGEEGEGRMMEREARKYTLPHVKQAANKNVLYASGNSNWGSVKT